MTFIGHKKYSLYIPNSLIIYFCQKMLNFYELFVVLRIIRRLVLSIIKNNDESR